MIIGGGATVSTPNVVDDMACLLGREPASVLQAASEMMKIAASNKHLVSDDDLRWFNMANNSGRSWRSIKIRPVRPLQAACL